jgi:hypothetical protein
VQPVAYDLDTYQVVNWIKKRSNNLKKNVNSDEVLLLGPCHLLQLSNFFNTDNNFFQYIKKGGVVKYDCPAFLLAKKEDLKGSTFVSDDFTWSIKDYDLFNLKINQIDTLVLSLEDFLSDNLYVKDNGLLFRYEGYLEHKYQTVRLPISKRVELLMSVLDGLVRRVKENCQIFLLDGVITNKTPENIKSVRLVYSHIINKHYRESLNIIDLSYYANRKKDLADGVHLDRLSYFNLFEDIVDNNVKTSLVDYSAYDNSKEFRTRYLNFRDLVTNKLKRNSALYKTARFIYRLLNVK